MRAKILFIAALILAGCASAPNSANSPADPPRLKAALEAESDGAKRYSRGDYAVAVRRFDESARIYASIDDAPGTARNRLHLARAQLALGHAETALMVLALAESSTDGGSTLEIRLLQAQANLALGRLTAAQANLATAATACPANCPQLASLHLLQARAALADKHAQDALVHAEAALKLLQDRDEAAETGNAWRLIAGARLAGSDAIGALPAARAALEIDRRLALPEKIARDWLLIGDIQRKIGAGEATALQGGRAKDALRAVADGDAAEAYRRALGVANAAGLSDIAGMATQALAENEISVKANTR